MEHWYVVVMAAMLLACALLSIVNSLKAGARSPRMVSAVATIAGAVIGASLPLGVLALAATALPVGAAPAAGASVVALVVGLAIAYRRHLAELRHAEEIERALGASEQRFRLAFENAPIGMALTDPVGRFVRVNSAYCRMIGYEERELLGNTFSLFTHPEELEMDRGYLERMTRGEIATFQREKRYLHKDGHTVWGLVSVSAVRDVDGRLAYFVSQVLDVTERKRMEEHLRVLVEHDALTGALSRHRFLAELEKELRQPAGGGAQGAILFIDLDGFKGVNDSLGHQAGDRVLQRVAEAARASVGPGDVVGRFGGDEFVVLLRGAGEQEAVRVAQSILQRFASGRDEGVEAPVVSVSIGVALFPVHGHNPQRILAAADSAMYEAKRRRCGYWLYDHPNPPSQ